MFWNELKIEEVPPSLAKNIYKRNDFNNVKNIIAMVTRSIRLCESD